MDIVILILAAHGWFSLGWWAMLIAESIIAYHRLEAPYMPRFVSHQDAIDGLIAMAMRIGMMAFGPALWLRVIWVCVFYRRGLWTFAGLGIYTEDRLEIAKKTRFLGSATKSISLRLDDSLCPSLDLARLSAGLAFIYKTARPPTRGGLLAKTFKSLAGQMIRRR